jgi:beta-galactosidase
VSEYGAGAALSQHTDDAAGGPINPHGRPHPEEYQSGYHEQAWQALKSRDYLWGTFIWNLFDFSTNSRSEGDLTDINEKGLISYDRATRKDAFYFYRANWSSEATLHLVGRRYVDRAYAVVDVKAYSNAAQAHLAANQRDLGTVPCAEGICNWRAVHLTPGNNELTATAQIAGRTVSDSLHWTLAHTDRIVCIKAGDISGYAAKSGLRYGSDAYFAGGVGRGINPPDTPAADRIAVSADDAPLYDSFREGDFEYHIPVPNGRYRVLLKFAEPTADAAGDRVFDVLVNGVPRLEALDIFSAAGARLKGVDRTLGVTVNNGLLDIAFRARRGSALVSALAITPADTP